MIRKKHSVVQVFIDDTTYIMPAVTVKCKGIPAHLPACDWCNEGKLHAVVEYIQHGFFADKHQVICGCENCFNATIFEYELAD